ncbi:MAG TPA: hypothetical protein VF826_11250 [Chloroflexia bacterium]|jgi:hypothetical protein
MMNENSIACLAAEHGSAVQQILLGTPIPFVAQPYEVKLEPFFAPAEVSFPHADRRMGRITYFAEGRRILDWDGTNWVAYAYEGVTWYEEDLTELDFFVLQRVLTPYLCRVYADLDGPTGPAIETGGYSPEAVRRIVSARTPLLAEFVAPYMQIGEGHTAKITCSSAGVWATQIDHEGGPGSLIWDGTTWSEYFFRWGDWTKSPVSDTGFRVLHHVLARQICVLFQSQPSESD